MAKFDYEVLIIGSGFGGSVAALRAVEKGYRVGVLEAGRRWRREDLPKTTWDVRKYSWQPEAELFGMQRIRYLDDVMVLSGSVVVVGSLVYANTLYKNDPLRVRVPFSAASDRVAKRRSARSAEAVRGGTT